MRGFAWLVFVAGLAAMAFAGWRFATQWRPSPQQFRFQGVDVDQSNGAIDWAAVKAGGADFGYIRATAGTTRDEAFAANWDGARGGNVRRGAIHVYSLCRLARDQAAAFMATVPRDADQLPGALALDFAEDCPARPERSVLLNELQTFLTAAETHLGKPMLLKVAKAFDAQYHVTGAVNRPVWSMQLAFPPEYAGRPWRLWQASSFRRLPGVERPLNWDVVAP